MSARRTSHATDPLQNSRDREKEAVRVKVLDGFSVSVGSRTIRKEAWRPKKAATLLKLLALVPVHRMHREQAVDLLWPDSGKKAASNNLRQVLYGACRVLASASWLGFAECACLATSVPEIERSGCRAGRVEQGAR